MDVKKTIEEFERKLALVRMRPADEIIRLGRGDAGRPTGSRGQYLTPLIFAEASARSLTDEVLWSLLDVARRREADLASLVVITCEFAKRKAEFFYFIDLKDISEDLEGFGGACRAVESFEEYDRLCSAALSYFNRIHVWIDAQVPWAICDGFKREKGLRPERRT